MDVMPQSYGSFLPSALQTVSVNTILRPVSLGDSDGFGGYFPEVSLSNGTELAAWPAPAEALSPVLAQQFDQDILGDMVSIWNNFVDSGQIWALFFGIVLGYMIRNLTAY
jgi:hypothetical protein